MSFISVELHKPMPLSWWLNEFTRGRVEMSPGYQRRSDLWGRWKKAHLIDSIINGFDIPKFYLADFNRAGSVLNESQKPYAVIDGKQRLEAIFSFIDDGFPLNSTATYHADATTHIAGLTYSDLLNHYPSVARLILDFIPVVMSVASDSAGMIEQMFVRLNSGVSVNGAERRNAMPGPIPPIVRDITVHPFFGDRVRFNRNRMQEFNLAAKLLMFEFEGGFADSKARNLDLFVQGAYEATVDIVGRLDTASAKGKRVEAARLSGELMRLSQPYKDAEDAVMVNLDKMATVFLPRDALLNKQGEIPVYYWVIRNKRIAIKHFRDFLSDFEPAVLANMRSARTDPDNADAELLAYYNHVRTSNDRASLVARYAIISKRFVAWWRARKPRVVRKGRVLRSASTPRKVKRT